MNIYDDLLNIIEEAKVHNIHQDYFGCVQFEKALQRAKKEHELLELYDKFMYHVIGGSMIVAYRIQDKILKLKEELEEMK